MHRTKATSFADVQDLLAFNRAIAQGWSTEKALEVGDNGIGAWGKSTVKGTGPCVALSRNTEGFTRGRLVRVFHGDRSVDADVRDLGPENVIDLNPDACEELGLKPPVSTLVDWIWL
jgi:hypothetical protein